MLQISETVLGPNHVQVATLVGPELRNNDEGGTMNDKSLFRVHNSCLFSAPPGQLRRWLDALELRVGLMVKKTWVGARLICLTRDGMRCVITAIH